MSESFKLYAYQVQIYQDQAWSCGLFLSENEPNFYTNPYPDPEHKILASILYFCQVMTTIVILIFIKIKTIGWQEASKSIINQMVPWMYFQSVSYSASVTLDLIGILNGPLPEWLCSLNAIAKNTFVLVFIILCLAILFLKYLYICVFKSYLEMNRKFVVTFALMASYLIGILASTSTILGSSKPTTFQSICSGTYRPLESKSGLIISMFNMVTHNCR